MLLPVSAPRPLPIETAIVRPGEPSDPCLLYVPAYAVWIIGQWDGEAWCELQSCYYVMPTHWAPLPAVPDRDLNIAQ